MKLFLTSLSICLSIAIIGIVALVYIDYSSASPRFPFNQKHQDSQTTNEANQEEGSSLVSEIPAKKLAEQTVEYEEFTANLKDSYIVLALQAVTDDKKGAEEAKQREFQLRNYLIKELSEVTAEQMSDSAFTETFINELKNYMNEEIDKGTILEIYVTNKLIQ